MKSVKACLVIFIAIIMILNGISGVCISKKLSTVSMTDASTTNSIVTSCTYENNTDTESKESLFQTQVVGVYTLEECCYECYIMDSCIYFVHFLNSNECYVGTRPLSSSSIQSDGVTFGTPNR